MKQINPPLQIAGELISITGLRGRSVYDRTGVRVGRLVDLLVSPDTTDARPLIQGALVRAKGRLFYLPEAAIAGIRDWTLYLCIVGLTLRPLAADLVPLSHHVRHCQLRASDVIVACSPDGLRLVGVDPSLRTLLRRLAPSLLRRRVIRHRIHPWPPPAPRLTPAPTSTRPTRQPAPPPYRPYTRPRRQPSAVGHRT